MVRHYPPAQNVVARPTMPDGTGIVNRAPRILFPLLYTMVRARLEGSQ